MVLDGASHGDDLFLSASGILPAAGGFGRNHACGTSHAGKGFVDEVDTDPGGRPRMNPKIDADGETWEASLDRHEPHPGVTALVFSCLTNSQRPWHVVEIPSSDVNGKGVEALGDDYLHTLFARSQTMDFLHGDPMDEQQLSYDPDSAPIETGH
jgi:hypothetical protein